MSDLYDRTSGRGYVSEQNKTAGYRGFETVWQQKATKSKRPRKGFYSHTRSIASSNKFDTDLYNDRPPSEGIYAATASATSSLSASWDIDRA
jgi:hypothetical protein